MNWSSPIRLRAPRDRVHASPVKLIPLGVAAAALALGLTACGGGDKPKEPIPFSDIDQDAWAHDLQETGHVRANPDLETLYNVARKDCTADDDNFGLTLRLTMTGATPDVDRIDMRYVCPSKAHLVDDALRQIQQNASDMDEACALPESMRTERQQNMVEAVGCS